MRKRERPEPRMPIRRNAPVVLYHREFKKPIYAPLWVVASIFVGPYFSDVLHSKMTEIVKS